MIYIVRSCSQKLRFLWP